MTSWTRNKDIKKRLEKKWNRGEFLRQSLAPDSFTPLRIPLKHPTAKELLHSFDAAREWISHLMDHAGTKAQNRYEIRWREVNHKTLGKNKVPKAVVFPTLNHIVAYLGKEKAATRFQALCRTILQQSPDLAGLLQERPMDVLAHDGVWDQLMDIAAYVRENPRPGIYLRQLEIRGVDTKFIERHKAFLNRILLVVLPPKAVDETAKGARGFEQRFGFLSKPVRIRFRSLDPDITIDGLTDLDIPGSDFCRLSIEPEIVFIVENEITGLSFPFVKKSIVIYKLGYALSALANVPWMKHKPIWYWGDMDTHGFAMLDQLRHYFTQTRSFLMDEKTLMAHKTFWGREPSPTHRDLAFLTPEEASVYDGLRQNEFAPRLRLEQERISFSDLRRAITMIQNGGVSCPEPQ